MLSDFVIGGISGVISRTMTAPLELYKLQRQNTFMPGSSITAVVKGEGIRYLWKGNATNCIRVFPQVGINYYVYAFINETVVTNINDEKTRRLVAGSIGGATSMILTYPLETIRSRLSLQMNKSHYKGLHHALQCIPPREMFQGMTLSILGYAPFTAISFTTYFSYKDYLQVNTKLDSDIVKILAGGTSGLTSIMITYPTDLIRRRLQLQNFDKNVPKYLGIIDCAKKIIKIDGYRGMYRGLFATCVKIVPTIAIQFFVLERLKSIN